MAESGNQILLKSASRVVGEVGQQLSPGRLFDSLSNTTHLLALQSLCNHNIYGRYSIVSFDPAMVLRCTDTSAGDPFQALDEMILHHTIGPREDGLPFVGGWMGYLSYEAGRFLERLPCTTDRDLDLPLAWFGFYDTVAIYDHFLRRWHVAGVEIPQQTQSGRTGLEDRLQDLEMRIVQCADMQAPPKLSRQPAALRPIDFNQTHYMSKVEVILDYIRAGDIYQANLTQRFGTSISLDGMELYRRLCIQNPGDYMAFIDCGDHQVLCSSPELFLQVRGDRVLTRPIKGTRPRSTDPAVDIALQADLLSSEKDLAELAMIVDLQRNDLGRVCESVSTTWPPIVESYATVHHLVTDVRGRLGRQRAPGDGWVPQARTVVDILRATFPGGSITGAPKIRAMQIIDELEPTARGPYCGSIGYIGLDGEMTMNIAIRTIVLKDAMAYVHAGSGIVIGSDPAAEYEEIIAKAKGMFAALGICSPEAQKPIA